MTIDFPDKLRSTRADGKLVDAAAIDGALPGMVTREILDLAVGGIFKRWAGGTLTAGQAHTLSVDVDSELGTFDDAVDGSRLVVFVSARIAAGDEATLKIESDASGSFETLDTVALSTSRRTGRLFAAVPTDVSGGYPEQVVRAVLTGSSTDNTVVEGMRLDVGMSRSEPVSDDERARINALALSTDALSQELDGLTEHVLDTAAWVDTVESDHVHVGHEADPGGSAAPSHGHPTLTINQNAVNQALTLWVPRGVRPEGYRLRRVRGGTTTTWPQDGEYWRAYTTGLRLAEDTFHLDAYFLASETSDAQISVNLNTGDLLKAQKNAIVTVLRGEKLKDGSVDIDALATAVAARLLPALPSAGARDGLGPRFAGDVLGWHAASGRTRIQLTGGVAPVMAAGTFAGVNFGSSSERTLQPWATIGLANRVTLEPGLYLCVIDAPFREATTGTAVFDGNNARLNAAFRMNGNNVWSRQITNPYIRVGGTDVWDHFYPESYELLVEVPAKTAVDLQARIRGQSATTGAVQFHDLSILRLS